jgi:O-antigen ligase
MFIFFLIGLFLLNLPPFKFSILNIQSIFGLINVFIFINILLVNKNRKLLINKIKKRKLEIYLLTGLFAIISFSIVQTLDVSLFLNKYASILISLLMYVNITFFDTKISKYIYAIISVWIIINLANELFLFLNPNLYLSSLSNFLIDKEYLLVRDEILRNRLTISTYVEIFLPILFWQYFNTNKNKPLLLGQIILINILALYSGWRIRGIICLISLIQVILLYFQRTKKTEYSLKLLTFIVPFLIFFLLNKNFIINSPTLNRIFYENQDAISSDETRTHVYGQSLDIFISNPLFGVGLGNNYIYRQNSQFSPDKNQNSSKLVREAGSHNFYIDLLLDVGIFGFIIFFSLLALWLYEDKINIKNNNKFPFVLACYLILFYALFHSIGGYRFFSILFLLRIIINQKDPHLFLKN